MLHPLISNLILMSNFQICDIYYFSKAFKKCKISTSTVSSIFIYFFFDNRYQNLLRKFGGSVVNQFI